MIVLVIRPIVVMPYVSNKYPNSRPIETPVFARPSARKLPWTSSTTPTPRSNVIKPFTVVIHGRSAREY